MVTLSKEVKKYYNKADTSVKKKMDKAFKKIEEGQGDRLYARGKLTENSYRLKMDHYRVIFEKIGPNIYIKSFNTKNNMTFHKEGYFN